MKIEWSRLTREEQQSIYHELMGGLPEFKSHVVFVDDTPRYPNQERFEVGLHFDNHADYERARLFIEGRQLATARPEAL